MSYLSFVLDRVLVECPRVCVVLCFSFLFFSHLPQKCVCSKPFERCIRVCFPCLPKAVLFFFFVFTAEGCVGGGRSRRVSVSFFFVGQGLKSLLFLLPSLSFLTFSLVRTFVVSFLLLCRRGNSDPTRLGECASLHNESRPDVLLFLFRLSTSDFSTFRVPSYGCSFRLPPVAARNFLRDD
jgi:hypothetical protein